MAKCGETRPKLTIPHCPVADDAGENEPIGTLDCKFVADYASMSLAEVENLNILEFYLLLHDATVYLLCQSDEGREYLERSRLLQQTEPDIAALRGSFGKGGGA